VPVNQSYRGGKEWQGERKREDGGEK